MNNEISIKDQIEFLEKQIEENKYSGDELDNLARMSGGTYNPGKFKDKKADKYFKAIIETLKTK